MSINIEYSPFAWVGRFFQFPENGEHSMLIDINGDGLPDRVFDINPKTDQKGLFAYLNTGNGFDNGKQWQSNLVSLWVCIKHSIR
jgi:hypothetical protein